LTEPLVSRDTLVPAQLYLQMMRGNSKFTYTPPELKVPYQFQIYKFKKNQCSGEATNDLFD
jgi:hypothetical protein